MLAVASIQHFVTFANFDGVDNLPFTAVEIVEKLLGCRFDGCHCLSPFAYAWLVKLILIIYTTQANVKRFTHQFLRLPYIPATAFWRWRCWLFARHVRRAGVATLHH